MIHICRCSRITTTYKKYLILKKISNNTLNPGSPLRGVFLTNDSPNDIHNSPLLDGIRKIDRNIEIWRSYMHAMKVRQGGTPLHLAI